MAQQVCVVLNAAEREQLAAIAAHRNRPRKHIERAHIVLASADRHSAQRVAQSIGVSRPTVWRWQQRFAETGVEGLLRDKTRKPGKAPIAADKAAQLVALTCTQPPHQATHWTGRAMAKAIGLSLGSVQRIWRAHKLQPHRLRTFKRSRDPGFAASLALQPEKSRVLPNKGRAPDARLPYYGEGNQEQRLYRFSRRDDIPETSGRGHGAVQSNARHAGRRWVREVVGQVVKTKDATGVQRGDVLVFIHGYNNSMAEVLTRHRILKRDLPTHGFAGTVISFDWPCYATALAYVADREEAKLTAFGLVRDCIWRVARMQSQLDCDINVHLLAHSTGAYVVQEAFDDADDRRAINSINWTVSQIALISGDISSASMTAGDADTESIYAHCVRLTNYSNGNDEVLQISNIKRVGIEPRVGRVGLPPLAPSIAVNVGCSGYYQAAIGPNAQGPAGITASHSWQFGDSVFTEDLAQTLNGNLDRTVITTREAVAVNRFALSVRR
jgi:transposase/pimeloyl-ACP methyl ester carboxylesterase